MACLSVLSLDVVVRFVDIGWFRDQHWPLSFHNIIDNMYICSLIFTRDNIYRQCVYLHPRNNRTEQWSLISMLNYQLLECKILCTLPEHLNSPLVFSGARVTRSLVLCVRFVDRYLCFCTFSFDHWVVCSSIYGFWLPLWYLQTILLLNPLLRKVWRYQRGKQKP